MARFTDGEWATQKVTGDDGALGFHNELINIDGRHYGACYNYTTGKIWFASVDE